MADALADAAALTLEEFGALAKLEAFAWRDGGIPAGDLKRLGLLLGVSAKQAGALWAEIGKKWARADDGRFVLPWMEAYRAKLAAHHAKQAENGRKGGRPPRHARPTDIQPNENPPLSFGLPLGSTPENPTESSSSASPTSSATPSTAAAAADAGDWATQYPAVVAALAPGQFEQLAERVRGGQFQLSAYLAVVDTAFDAPDPAERPTATHVQAAVADFVTGAERVTPKVLHDFLNASCAAPAQRPPKRPGFRHRGGSLTASATDVAKWGDPAEPW